MWGHVSSKDMVYWQHHPPALEPGKFSPKKEGFFKWDADGCFTGSATISEDGKPTILYTGGCQSLLSTFHTISPACIDPLLKMNGFADGMWHACRMGVYFNIV